MERRWHSQFGKRIYAEKPRFKKIDPQRLYALVSAYISGRAGSFVYAETLAKLFQVRTHEIRQVFHRLNLEGKMGQARHWGGGSLWWMHTRFDHNDAVIQWEAKRYEIYG